jgi:ATP-dependent helicase Lhr and Lhr-like helicase
MSVNDYGFELMSALAVNWQPLIDAQLFGAENLLSDVLASLNSSELAQRRFREIARISGLVFQGFPGAPKSAKQVQASSGLFFEVFRKYDPSNLLLQQAEQEVLQQELDIERLAQVLARMRSAQRDVVILERPSPMCLPLMVERLREELSTEALAQRLARLIDQDCL